MAARQSAARTVSPARPRRAAQSIIVDNGKTTMHSNAKQIERKATDAAKAAALALKQAKTALAEEPARIAEFRTFHSQRGNVALASWVAVFVRRQVFKDDAVGGFDTVRAYLANRFKLDARRDAAALRSVENSWDYLGRKGRAALGWDTSKVAKRSARKAAVTLAKVQTYLDKNFGKLTVTDMAAILTSMTKVYRAARSSAVDASNQRAARGARSDKSDALKSQIASDNQTLSDSQNDATTSAAA